MRGVENDTKSPRTSSEFYTSVGTALMYYPTSLATGYDTVSNLSESVTTMVAHANRSRSSTVMLRMRTGMVIPFHVQFCLHLGFDL